MPLLEREGVCGDCGRVWDRPRNVLLIINCQCSLWLYFIVMMRSHILALLCLVLLLVTAVTSDEPTRLTYYVEHEEEQDEDFIEI